MTNYCVAALPEQNDPVWKVSSEKKPHMTILYFEDPTDKIDQPAMMLYIQHVAKTVLRPSGISVERRGVLGDQGADVLFFEDTYGYLDQWKTFRNSLLQDQKVFVAVENTFQYPKWMPHLTLGYPETPARDVEEAKQLSHVRFDRLAVWNDDYEGPEFLLTRNSYSDHETSSEFSMAEGLDVFLEHYGVKGMKWGVRKSESSESTGVRSHYAELRNRKAEVLDLKTDRGVSVKLKEDRVNPIGAAVGAISPRARANLNNSRTFKIEVDGKNVGEASMRRKSDEELNLEWIGVRPEHRGKGYASSVFGSAVAYGKEKGFSKLTLEVPGNSPDARHIYNKFGFKDTGKKFDDEDEIAWGGLTEMAYDIPKRR